MKKRDVSAYIVRLNAMIEQAESVGDTSRAAALRLALHEFSLIVFAEEATLGKVRR